MEKEVLAQLLVGLFMLILAVLIKYLKWHWLIAGYNTARKEDKKKIDIEGYAKMMGNVFFILGTIILTLFFLGYFEILSGGTIGAIMVILVFATAGYLLAQASKFTKD